MAAGEALFVTRTMQAMEVLAFQPSSAAQLAEALQIHPRTARRLLARLVADGWVSRSEGRRRDYAPTMRLVALAAQLAERSPLTRAATPAVTELFEQTGGVVHLAIPSYTSALCLVHRAGSEEARPHLRELVPAHATASGKVLLAYRDAWRESVLDVLLEPVTAHTVTDPERLRREVAEIRERGYALEREEYAEGLGSVAAPVRDPAGEVPAALALTLPMPVLQETDLDRLGARVRAAAGTVADALGGRGHG
ncbi:MAG TPA: IclR family transcriptional regulator [Solirubrobacter sp.]|nr:IclR family transcriptional regulator [Solirubrobacter sp.]